MPAPTAETPMMASPLDAMPAEHARVLIAIRDSPRGSPLARNLDPAAVAELAELGWVEFWLARARVTLSPGGAAAMGLRLSPCRRWMPVDGKLSRPRAVELPGQTTATAAGIDLDGNPEGWSPRDNGNHRPPHVLIGSSAPWDGPDLNNLVRPDRECRGCGGLEIPRGRGCLKCDRLGGEKARPVRAAKRRKTA